MLVRRLVTGVRSSCDASATSRRCAATEPSSVSSMVLKRAAIRPTSSLPRASTRRARSSVAVMCSAASVRSVTGWMTGRENSRPSAAASAVPATQQREQQPAQARERRVDAGEAAPEHGTRRRPASAPC